MILNYLDPLFKEVRVFKVSMPNMIGRPGCQTMEEMNGGSSGSYLARTPCVPLFCIGAIGVEKEGFLDCQGRAGIMLLPLPDLKFDVNRHE